MSTLRFTERFNFSPGLASFVAIGEAMGFWPIACGIALAAFEYLVVLNYGAPLWWVIPATIFTIGATIWTFNQAAVYRRHIGERAQQTAVDYERWDRFNELTIWDAACLWDEKRPNSPILSNKGVDIMRRIKRAINTRRIPGAPLTEHGHAHRNTMVSRDSLKALASTRGERPPFLFPEERR